MKKKVIAFLLTFTMVSGVVTGCGSQQTATNEVQAPDAGVAESTQQEAAADDSAKDDGTAEPGKEEADKAEAAETVDVSDNEVALAGSILGDEEMIYYDKDLVPSVKEYEIEDDFSNVFVADDFKGRVGLDPKTGKIAKDNKSGQALREALVENSFAVIGDRGYSEFFDLYEDNRYAKFPNFITVDSLMHTYHLYFAYLLRNCEKDFIFDELKKLSQGMLEASGKQYEELKGTDWEEAALRNIGIAYVGAYLLDDSVKLPVDDKDLSDAVGNELKKIDDAGGIEICAFSGEEEDYTQYKPRGYYTTDESLEKYFRSMMWFGRIPFVLHEKEGAKSAILMNLAIDDAGKDSWEAIYNITSFFAGNSDDTGYDKLMPVIKAAYGGVPTAKELQDNTEGLASVTKAALGLPMPKINSIPVEDGDDPIIPSYRIMGQRFTIDAAIMQKLVYSSVGDNGKGGKRMLPDALDVSAVLGSAEAAKILEEDGAMEYAGYTDNVVLLKKLYANDDPEIWNVNLYSWWLNTLRPLLEKKGEGYPKFMQSDEWAKKNLETFEGSYAELKHDTILYAKQVYAEMGDGEEPVNDDRGYVEPQPVVYSRFIFLADRTKEGLEGYGMLPKGADEDLERLSTIGKTLLTISEKELKEETLTDDEYEFIRNYGGDLEHFWRETMEDTVEGGLAYSYQAPCPIIADIATDPNGTILEVGSGEAQTMYVVFPVDGELRMGSGAVYSFYEFEAPMDNRLTDEEWRSMLSGGYLDDNYNWVPNDNTPVQPKWTQSYRVVVDGIG